MSEDPRFRDSRSHINYLKDKTDLIVVEVGVWKGIHAEWLYENLDINTLYLIDPYEAQDGITNDRINYIRDIAHDRFSKKNDVTWIEKKSDEAVTELTTNPDYVYVDGDHHYEWVRRDMLNFYSILDQGGVLAGHDMGGYGELGSEVTKAFVEFSTEKSLHPYSERNCPDWYFIKGNNM